MSMLLFNTVTKKWSLIVARGDDARGASEHKLLAAPTLPEVPKAKVFLNSDQQSRVLVLLEQERNPLSVQQKFYEETGLEYSRTGLYTIAKKAGIVISARTSFDELASFRAQHPWPETVQRTNTPQP